MDTMPTMPTTPTTPTTPTRPPRTLDAALRRVAMLAEQGEVQSPAGDAMRDLVAVLLDAAHYDNADGFVGGPPTAPPAHAPLVVHQRVLGRLAQRTAGCAIHLSEESTVQIERRARAVAVQRSTLRPSRRVRSQGERREESSQDTLDTGVRRGGSSHPGGRCVQFGL